MGSRLELDLVWARDGRVWPLVRWGAMHWLVLTTDMEGVLAPYCFVVFAIA